MAVRPTMAPTATAAAKSIAVHCASVRRSPSRSPSRAAAYINTALPAVMPRSVHDEVSQDMRAHLLRVVWSPAGALAAVLDVEPGVEIGAVGLVLALLGGAEGHLGLARLLPVRAELPARCRHWGCRLPSACRS